MTLRYLVIIGVQDYILNTFDFVEFRIIIGVQDYILNTFDFVEFRIIIIIIILLLLLFSFFLVLRSRFLKNYCTDCSETLLYILINSNASSLIENILTLNNDLDLYILRTVFCLSWAISQKPLVEYLHIFRQNR